LNVPSAVDVAAEIRAAIVAEDTTVTVNTAGVGVAADIANTADKASTADTASTVSPAIRLKNPTNTEIAFFGGSFTCLPKRFMTELLTVAAGFVKQYNLKGIRISTRPDAITPEVLKTLSAYGVTAIELGAQSLDDSILAINKRGHTAADVIKAVKCIREYFHGELGLQMMTGMAGATAQSDMATAESIAKLAPDTVRIYPAVVIAGTVFDDLRKNGQYIPIGFDEMVSLVADMAVLFEKAGIRVIRVGLHASEMLEADCTGGFYHPAFGELVEGELFYRKIREELKSQGTYKIYVNPKNVSKAIGQHRKNIIKLQENGYNITVIADECMSASRYVRIRESEKD
jgi:histone acetyltransferase (RNA polymerase elongator complex component)